LEIDQPIATITLNRSEKLNAIHPDMLVAFDEALTQIELDRNVRVVLLTGARERAFCVGADIFSWSALEPVEMWRGWIRQGHRLFNRIARLQQPVIAVLQGYTLGGGLELALAADLRLAAEEVELGLPEAKLGMIPGWGGTQRLPALIGAARAKQMIFTAARISAQTALAWGLVNEVVPRADLMPRAVALAQEIAANAPIAVQLAKQLIDGGLGEATPTTLEALAGALAATTEDGREGVAAFRDRRDAHFQNR
jgi:enoyl-CoA hydratase/carnithine racemase